MNLQVRERVRRVTTFRWYLFFAQPTDHGILDLRPSFLVCLEPKIYPHRWFRTPRFRNQAIAIASSTIFSTTFASQCVGQLPPSYHRIHVEWTSTHAHYELCDLGRACCIPVHRYSVGIATGYTDLSQIPQITKNTGISPNITMYVRKFNGMFTLTCTEYPTACCSQQGPPKNCGASCQTWSKCATQVWI